LVDQVEFADVIIIKQEPILVTPYDFGTVDSV